jgi:hypothetical protein
MHGSDVVWSSEETEITHFALLQAAQLRTLASHDLNQAAPNSRYRQGQYLFWQDGSAWIPIGP